MFTLPSLLLSLAAAATAVQGATLRMRQEMSFSNGTIHQPIADEILVANTTFDFSYTQPNSCESGYSLFTVYLTAQEPAFSQLDTNGNFPDDEFLFSFGEFTVPNFGESFESLNTRATKY